MIWGGLRRLGRLLAVAVVIFVWLPAFVFVAGLAVTALTGCSATEAGPQPCIVAGKDIGHQIYGMVMMGWIVIALLPLLLATMIVVVAWGAVRFTRARRRALSTATPRGREGSPSGGRP